MSEAHRIVSSESEELILVDRDDNETGHRSKADCHDGQGILHRAFSVFLFDSEGRVLLQKRADGKRLWPGYWSNSCCSHPRRGESLRVATARRLHDELQVDAPLEFVYKFRYQASFGNAGAEHELCHVYLGRIVGVPHPNETEIAAIRYFEAPRLSRELAARPELFTPWLQLEWEALVSKHAAQLKAYIEPGAD